MYKAISLYISRYKERITSDSDLEYHLVLLLKTGQVMPCISITWLYYFASLF